MSTSYKPLHIVFHLDGSGLIFDVNEPVHLDALLAWAIAPMIGASRQLGRGDTPDVLPVETLRHYFKDGTFVNCASALFPVGKTGEDLRFWRKRFRSSRAELTGGSPNLTNGVYRDWNNPMQILMVKELEAWAMSNKSKMRHLLKQIKFIGKKGAYGYGRVVGVDVEDCEQDYSLVRDGMAQRWLPDANGTRLVRLTPPYWNSVNRVLCCEVGDALDQI